MYSLAMTILETFTSEIPFPKRTDQSLTMHVVVKKKIPARPDIIPERSKCGNILWVILTSCWSYEPDLRPDVETVLSLMKPLTMDKLKQVGEKQPEQDESDGE
ncbi:hypothetical protein RSOLAG22IIIB_02659 [Rhizoctonia solani]|uniref:Protein kinase domain-containing protein n=1 Tax=Rhizoctonia solani TaxID=456999 RepID=A0A0K6GI62_9AGAM|nr:hypothetical protein RSOLAG22IIIB_02659 [Rhizoctonia solani]